MPSPYPSVYIAGTGSYAPANAVTNDQLAQRVDTSDEWIFSRSGIKERRIAGDEETTSDLAAAAAQKAIISAGLAKEDIDLIIVGTITPDMSFPSTACLVQEKLGLTAIPCFDLEAACSGFIYLIDVASSMLKAGRYRHALIIGAEKMSSCIDWSDRTTCVLFGDGAGAAVLSKTDQDYGVIDTLLGADGRNAGLLEQPAGGSRQPASNESVASHGHYLKMNGKEIFKHAVRVMEQAAIEILERNQLSAESLACIVPHQANIRIIENLANRLKVPMSSIANNLSNYGNTSAASIPLALDEAVRAGRIKSGDIVLLVAFGAGLTWASSLVKWK